MTAVGWEKPEHPVADAVGAVVAALDGAAEVSLWSLSDEEVEGLLRSTHGARARVDELVLRLVSEVARRRTGERSGATSARAWLRRELQLSPAEAKREVTLAAALHGPLELTRAALAAGDISREHAVVAARVMDTLPVGLGADVVDRAERQLLDWCRDFDPPDVARLGKRLWEIVDPDGAEAREASALAQEREAKRKRHLALGSDGFGSFRLWGQLDAESTAIVKAALDPLAQPLPATVEGPDPRTPGQRYADAFVELCRRQLGAGDLPTRGGEKPHVVVTIGIDQLKSAVGSGLLESGDDLSPETARRLACDAQVIPALLGTDGQPLDLGRTARTFTPAQRRALGLRDGYGCAFPGCDRPIAWCDGHHIRHWIDGGPTDLDNGVLLCCYHHTLIHKNDWAVRMAVDGRPEFIPPAWVDRDRKPLRNHLHRRE
ncbi:MAG TPA: DUF222 domain-containing protein [Nocardioidaceae bacterium]|nr:DUF222 domain-containing protein [Nocardioidaceae bacterium]